MLDDLDSFTSLEIKLESDKLILKDEPENISKECNDGFKFDMNLPTNFTEIKIDPSIDSNFPKDVATSKVDNFFNSKLQIKVEQKEEDDAHLVQASSISDADQITFKYEINKEIKQEELIIKDEPEEIEKSSSLEIKYNTNPPIFNITDHTSNTGIKVEPSTTRISELLKICPSDIQGSRLPEHVFPSTMDKYINFNLQDNVGQQCEDEDYTAQNTFECKVCSLYVPSNLFKQHMLSHKDSKHKLGKHEEIHEDKKLFMCLQCGKGFTRHPHLKAHMLIHGNVKPFHCQQCGKDFTQNSHLKVHMLTHNSNRPFSCQQCDRNFTLKCNLNAHMLLHQNARPFNCQQCGKCFLQNRDLKMHMLIHEDKRPFNCQQCGKGFNRNYRLKAHILTHENKKPFACQQCDKGFTRSDRLKAHMLIHEERNQPANDDKVL